MKLTPKNLIGLAALLVGCSSTPRPSIVRNGDGVLASSLPPEQRDNYALFAQRCSKCHALSRPLNNGDHDSAYWTRYVSRMRRQPSSGIAPEDEPPIVDFLNYYSSQLRIGADAGGGR